MINITKLHNMDGGSEIVERSFPTFACGPEVFHAQERPVVKRKEYTHKDKKFTLIGFVLFLCWVLGPDGIRDRFGCIC